MKMHLLCPALLVVVLFCDATLGVEEEICTTYNKEKIGACNEHKGFTPNDKWIGQEGLEGCKAVCREKGYISGCCSDPEQDCWCALARIPGPTKKPVA